MQTDIYNERGIRYETEPCPFVPCYRRNKAIEERFNVNIVGIEGEEEPMVKTLMSSVVAGEDAYELFMGHSIYSGETALSYCIPDLLKGTKEVSSYTASKEKSVIKHYESVAELFFAEE